MYDAPAEAHRLRIADGLTTDEATRLDATSPRGAASVVGVTTTVGTYPTTAAVYYAITPAAVTGTETAGTAGTLTPLVGVFYALNLGSTVPPTGTTVLCTEVSYRWVFRYDG